jgi:hypothetical protein
MDVLASNADAGSIYLKSEMRPANRFNEGVPPTEAFFGDQSNRCAANHTLGTQKRVALGMDISNLVRPA